MISNIIDVVHNGKMSVLKTGADGNCQFRSISIAISGFDNECKKTMKQKEINAFDDR